jgi:site-specific DNA recombinase
MQEQNNQLNKEVVVYGRVSSTNQENEGTIETQLSAVRDYASINGITILKEYIDEGWSGDILQRPALDQLRMDAKKKLWKSVLIYDPDRLARRYSFQELVVDELREKNVEVLFVTTPTPKDGIEKILYGVQGLFAEYERAKIAERFRLGKVRKAKEGHIIATEAPYGYTFIPRKGKKGDADFYQGYYTINQEELEHLQKIFLWVGEEGLTLRQTVRRLQELQISPRKSKRGVWNTSTLGTLLRNKTYIGEGHFGASMATIPIKPLKTELYRKVKKTSRRMKPESEWIKIPTPKLIEEELFYRVQNQLQVNIKKSPRNTKNEYLLTGKIWCNCGKRRTGESAQKGKHLYYRCTDRIYSFPLLPNCKEKGINGKNADEKIWNMLQELITNEQILKAHIQKKIEYKNSQPQHNESDIKNIEVLLSKMKEQEDRYVKAYGMGLITIEQFQQNVLPLRKQIEQKQKEIIQLEIKHEQPINDVVTENDIKSIAERFKSSLQNIPFVVKKKIIDKIIDRIEGDKEKLKVYATLSLNQNNYVTLCTEYRNTQDIIQQTPYPISHIDKEIHFEFEVLLND